MLQYPHMIAVGIGLSFVAMLCWGFGDFWIQRSTRKVGDWETLFIMTAFGTVVLLPFVWKTLPAIFMNGGQTLTILILASVVLFVAALLDFEGLRLGKLSVVEPIWSFEIPVSAFLAFVIIAERVSFAQMILVFLLLIFLIMVAFRGTKVSWSFFIERGVIIAFLGALMMGASNFFMGWGGRISDPLMVNFFTDAVLMILTGLYLVASGSWRHVGRDLRANLTTLLPMSIADKAAWVAYVFAMSLAPIAVATALSESYIIIAVLLGLYVNKERIQIHQKVGLVGAVLTALVLAALTSGV